MMSLNPKIGRILFKGEWSPQQVDSAWNPSAPPLPTQLQQSIDQFWRQRQARHTFNGDLARLAGYEFRETGLKLYLQASDYKTLLYSNQHASRLAEKNPEHLSRALGISAIVETNNNSIVYIKRSDKVGEYPLVHDIPGGHIDVPESGTPDAFASIKQEIIEELGIPVRNPIELIGMIETFETLKPELIFKFFSQLSEKDIKNFGRTAKDRFEYTDLLFCPCDKLSALLSDKTFSPSAYSSLVLYSQTQEVIC
ncbi:MAG: hypothetical protein U5R06_03480 [candidate division KSB1 bacterium]|nr:hypothetical protein [candidate division KSB1 bacterium]